MTDFEMRDAAFTSGLAGWGGAVAGYVGGPNAYHTWSPADWAYFVASKQPKLPIWVGGFNGESEGWACLSALRHLGVPLGKAVALDLETRRDIAYVTAFAAVLQWGGAGYRVWPYGSASTVFGNPQLTGYWVADYAGVGPFMYDHTGVRATQYASGPQYDSSLVKDWELANLWK